MNVAVFVRQGLNQTAQLVLLDHGLYETMNEADRHSLSNFYKAVVLKDEENMKHYALRMNIAGRFPAILAGSGRTIRIVILFCYAIVGKAKKPRMFFSAGGQSNQFSQFKVDAVCSPIFLHCGSFSFRSRRPLLYAKLSGTNLKMGACRGDFSINRLLVEPLTARLLTVAEIHI